MYTFSIVLLTLLYPPCGRVHAKCNRAREADVGGRPRALSIHAPLPLDQLISAHHVLLSVGQPDICPRHLFPTHLFSYHRHLPLFCLNNIVLDKFFIIFRRRKVYKSNLTAPSSVFTERVFYRCFGHKRCKCKHV